MGFEIAKAYVTVKADSTGFREEVRKDVEEAGLGQKIKVALGVDKDSLSKADLGGLFSNLAPFIIPTVAAVGNLTGALGLVPAAVGAAGIAFATAKVGVSGFSDAVKKGGDDLKALPPSAREAATAIRNLGPAWQNLHMDVQSRLFQGVGKDIQRLGIVDLPVLRRGLDATAGSLNQGIHYFTAWATSSKTIGDLKTIFDNTGISTQNLMRSLQPILGILRDVATVGSTFLPQLTSGFATAAQKAADFISHARDTGKLHDWIQTGLDAVRTLKDVFKDLFDIVKKVSENSGPVSMLDILKLVTGSIRWLVDNMPGIIPIVEAIIVTVKAWRLAQLALNTVTKANPWMLVVAAIAVAAVEIYTHWDAIKKFLGDAWNWIKNTASSIWTGIRDFFVDIWNKIHDTITGTWNSASSFLTGALNGFRNFFSSVWNGIVGDFQGIWGRITGIASGVWDAVTGAFRTGVNTVIGLINGLINDVDDVLGFLHIALIPHVPLLAAGGVVGLAGGGTVGKGFTTKGPMAIVGEGNPAHPEYVIPTDPAHRSNALALYQSLGAQLMADGGILGTITDWLGGGAAGAIGAVVDKLAAIIPAGMFRDIASGVGHMAAEGVKAMLGSAFSSGAGGGDLGAWIAAALAITGTPGSWAGPLRVLVMRESGGNPHAINLYDSNARAGIPSQGLAQVIPPTFMAYHQAGTSWNIQDPIANLAAAINYIKGRYGSIFAVQQANPNLPPKGYDSGGLLPTGLSHVYNGTGRPEAVFTAKQMDALTKNRGHGPVTVNVIQQSGSPQETGRAVALALRTVG